MGSNQTNVAKESATVQNNIIQDSDETCVANCTNVSSGNTIIFNGDNINGSINFDQSCEATASCLMKEQLQSQVQNIMTAIAEQTEKTEKFFLSFNISNEVNSSEINQNITNSITQVMQSSCQATSENIRTGDLLILENTTADSFAFGQNGDAKANCTMNNLAKQVTFNQQTAKQNQSQKIESVFAIIAIAVIVVVIVGAIIVFITLRKTGSSAAKFVEKNPEVLLA